LETKILGSTKAKNRMSWQTDRDMAVNFLRRQMNEIDSKITRLESALDSCDECLEANGLEASLHNVELERELLGDLLMNQLDASALSLDALIMRQAEQYRHEANQLAQHWHRGQQTPPNYWDAEVRQSYLTELLGRFHAWQDGRPYYVPDNQEPVELAEEPEHAYPWFAEPVQNIQQSTEEANMVREDIFSALRRHGYPFDHLKITVQPGGQVTITGYAHDTDEREHILRIITDVESVVQVMADVKVVDEAHCPVCNPDLKNGETESGS
jgi:hypothetical protein